MSRFILSFMGNACVRGGRTALKGMSVVEIMVVVALSSLILLGGTVMMSRTTRSFKKGTDMLNTQVLMDNIVERLRTDIRSLKVVNVEKCTKNAFAFTMIQDGETLDAVYEYDPDSKTLFRTAERLIPGTPPKKESVKTDFHGAKQVVSLLLQPYPKPETFRHLNVAMQLRSDEKGEGKASTLAIVCQFHSVCLEPRISFGEVNK